MPLRSGHGLSLRLNCAPLVVVANANIRRQEGSMFHHFVDLFEATTSSLNGNVS
jgi:hypothetical protein